MVAGSALQKFGAELEQHQQLIIAASRIMQEIYMVESAMLRAEKIANVKGADAVKNAEKLVQLQLFKSVEIIKSFNDDRVKLLEQKVNKGASEARNKGLNLANGRFITFIDSDDLWLPNFLEKTIS